jgi:hypothetical protein
MAHRNVPPLIESVTVTVVASGDALRVRSDCRAVTVRSAEQLAVFSWSSVTEIVWPVLPERSPLSASGGVFALKARDDELV